MTSPSSASLSGAHPPSFSSSFGMYSAFPGDDRRPPSLTADPGSSMDLPSFKSASPLRERMSSRSPGGSLSQGGGTNSAAKLGASPLGRRFRSGGILEIDTKDSSRQSSDLADEYVASKLREHETRIISNTALLSEHEQRLSSRFGVDPCQNSLQPDEVQRLLAAAGEYAVAHVDSSFEKHMQAFKQYLDLTQKQQQTTVNDNHQQHKNSLGQVLVAVQQQREANLREQQQQRQDMKEIMRALQEQLQLLQSQQIQNQREQASSLQKAMVDATKEQQASLQEVILAVQSSASTLEKASSAVASAASPCFKDLKVDTESPTVRFKAFEQPKEYFADASISSLGATEGCLKESSKIHTPSAAAHAAFPLARSSSGVSTNTDGQTPSGINNGMQFYQSEGLNSMSSPLLEGDHLRELSRRSSIARLGTLFPDVENLKCSVHDAISSQAYDVEALYHEEGLAASIATNEYFKGSILFVIFLNTLWIGYSTDNNHADILCKAAPIFQIGENLFCTIFVAEIIFRFLAFKNKLDALLDAWFVFDSFLVGLMAWETWVEVLLYLLFDAAGGNARSASHVQALRMTRLVRLMRVARATRLLHAVPELAILSGAMVSGIRSVLAVLCLLAIIVYVFAIMFTLTLSDTEIGAQYFSSVPQSANSLLLQVLCGADSDFMKKLLSISWVYYVMYLGFLLVAVLTLMNMLIGILCDVVSDEAESSKADALAKEVKKQITRMAKEIDADGSGTIDKDEFDIILKDPVVMTSFHSLGVDIVGLAGFAKFIYEQCDEISYPDFAQMVSHFRGNKPASIQDVMDMRRYLTVELLSLESRLLTSFGLRPC